MRRRTKAGTPGQHTAGARGRSQRWHAHATRTLEPLRSKPFRSLRNSRTCNLLGARASLRHALPALLHHMLTGYGMVTESPPERRRHRGTEQATSWDISKSKDEPCQTSESEEVVCDGPPAGPPRQPAPPELRAAPTRGGKKTRCARRFQRASVQSLGRRSGQPRVLRKPWEKVVMCGPPSPATPVNHSACRQCRCAAGAQQDLGWPRNQVIPFESERADAQEDKPTSSQASEIAPPATRGQ